MERLKGIPERIGGMSYFVYSSKNGFRIIELKESISSPLLNMFVKAWGIGPFWMNNRQSKSKRYKILKTAIYLN